MTSSPGSQQAPRTGASGSYSPSTSASSQPTLGTRSPSVPSGVATDTVTEVIDGDTLTVEGHGRVRLVGVDTPERGACGSAQATAHLEAVVLGKTVSLLPDGRDDRDRYGRLLRYVEVGGTDAGRDLLGAGLATARYDSRDGYGAHPREADYVALDARTPNYSCGGGAPQRSVKSSSS